MIYAFIAEHTQYPVKKWADFFGVSTSGYYTWRSSRAKREACEERYRTLIRTIFAGSNGTYGADRVCGQLRQDRHTASYGRVKRIMREEGLYSRPLINDGAREETSFAQKRGGIDMSREALEALKLPVIWNPTQKGWLARRAEIVRLLCREEYGFPPPKPERLTWKMEDEDRLSLCSLF